MRVLDSLITKLKGYNEAIVLYVHELMSSAPYQEWLISANHQNLESGIRADGSEIEKTPRIGQQSDRYERYTQHLKKKKEGIAGVYDHVTLYDTGTFYNSEKIEESGDAWFFRFMDQKYATLIEPVWGQVGGITVGQKSEFIEMLYIDLSAYTKKYFLN